MDVDTTRQIGQKLRRATANRDLLAYIDATLPLLGKVVVPDEPSVNKAGACPVCEARRRARTGAQRKWRQRQKVPF